MTQQDESDQERRDRLERQAWSGPAIDRQAYRRASRRSFLTGAASIAAGALGWRWVQTQPEADNIPRVIRAGHEANERLWRALSSNARRAPEYEIADAGDLRVNGRVGIRQEIDLDAWTLQVRNGQGGLLDELVLADVLAHDHVEMVAEHKCIEGWSTIAHWTGVRFSDVARAYAGEVESSRYVGLATPDDGYYVGLERSAALHPQTLLAFALDGEPLTQEHGAPLRLVTPNHYGIKSIKRIGSITFTNVRPDDYWAERGYDWYSRF